MGKSVACVMIVIAMLDMPHERLGLTPAGAFQCAAEGLQISGYPANPSLENLKAAGLVEGHGPPPVGIELTPDGVYIENLRKSFPAMIGLPEVVLGAPVGIDINHVELLWLGPTSYLIRGNVDVYTTFYVQRPWGQDITSDLWHTFPSGASCLFDILPWWVDLTASLIGGSEIQPAGIAGVDPSKRQAEIAVGGALALRDAYIAFFAQGVPNTGGHDAFWHDGGKPTGEFFPRPVGKFDNGKPLKLVKVNPGLVNVGTIYRAGEFSGEDEIIMKVSDRPWWGDGSADPNSEEEQSDALEAVQQGHGPFDVPVPPLKVTVRVPDLVRLKDVPGNNWQTQYMLVGGTCQHHGPAHPDRGIDAECQTPDNNHYGTENAIKDIDAAGVEIRNAKWNVSSETPLINDISLPWGGGFDVGGSWSPDLVDPNVGHASHRTGMDVDLNNTSLWDNKTEKFRKLMCNRGWKFLKRGRGDVHFRYQACPP